MGGSQSEQCLDSILKLDQNGGGNFSAVVSIDKSVSESTLKKKTTGKAEKMQIEFLSCQILEISEVPEEISYSDL